MIGEAPRLSLDDVIKNTVQGILQHSGKPSVGETELKAAVESIPFLSGFDDHPAVREMRLLIHQFLVEEQKSNPRLLFTGSVQKYSSAAEFLRSVEPSRYDALKQECKRLLWKKEISDSAPAASSGKSESSHTLPASAGLKESETLKDSVQVLNLDDGGISAIIFGEDGRLELEAGFSSSDPLNGPCDAFILDDIDFSQDTLRDNAANLIREWHEKSRGSTHNLPRNEIFSVDVPLPVNGEYHSASTLLTESAELRDALTIVAESNGVSDFFDSPSNRECVIEASLFVLGEYLRADHGKRQLVSDGKEYSEQVTDSSFSKIADAVEKLLSSCMEAADGEQLHSYLPILIEKMNVCSLTLEEDWNHASALLEESDSGASSTLNRVLDILVKTVLRSLHTLPACWTSLTDEEVLELFLLFLKSLTPSRKTILLSVYDTQASWLESWCCRPCIAAKLQLLPFTAEGQTILEGILDYSFQSDYIGAVMTVVLPFVCRTVFERCTDTSTSSNDQPSSSATGLCIASFKEAVSADRSLSSSHRFSVVPKWKPLILSCLLKATDCALGISSSLSSASRGLIVECFFQCSAYLPWDVKQTLFSYVVDRLPKVNNSDGAQKDPIPKEDEIRFALMILTTLLNSNDSLVFSGSPQDEKFLEIQTTSVQSKEKLDCWLAGSLTSVFTQLAVSSECTRSSSSSSAGVTLAILHHFISSAFPCTASCFPQTLLTVLQVITGDWNSRLMSTHEALLVRIPSMLVAASLNPSGWSTIASALYENSFQSVLTRDTFDEHCQPFKIFMEALLSSILQADLEIALDRKKKSNSLLPDGFLSLTSVQALDMLSSLQVPHSALGVLQRWGCVSSHLPLGLGQFIRSFISQSRESENDFFPVSVKYDMNVQNPFLVSLRQTKKAARNDFFCSLYQTVSMVETSFSSTLSLRPVILPSNSEYQPESRLSLSVAEQLWVDLVGAAGKQELYSTPSHLFRWTQTFKLFLWSCRMSSTASFSLVSTPCSESFTLLRASSFILESIRFVVSPPSRVLADAVEATFAGRNSFGRLEALSDNFAELANVLCPHGSEGVTVVPFSVQREVMEPHERVPPPSCMQSPFFFSQFAHLSSFTMQKMQEYFFLWQAEEGREQEVLSQFSARTAAEWEVFLGKDVLEGDGGTSLTLSVFSLLNSRNESLIQHSLLYGVDLFFMVKLALTHWIGCLSCSSKPSRRAAMTSLKVFLTGGVQKWREWVSDRLEVLCFIAFQCEQKHKEEADVSDACGREVCVTREHSHLENLLKTEEAQKLGKVFQQFPGQNIYSKVKTMFFTPMCCWIILCGFFFPDLIFAP